MNICIVSEYFVGGGFTSVLNQKKALEKHGHTVTLLQLARRPRPKSLPEDAVLFDPAFILPGGLAVVFQSRRNRERVRRILVERKIEVVHFQSEFSIAYLVHGVAKSLGIPTLYTCHTFYWEYSSPFAGLFAVVARLLYFLMLGKPLAKGKVTGNAFEKVLKLQTLTFANKNDTVISPSAHQREALIAAGLKPPCAVVPNPYINNAKTQPHLLAAAPNPIRLVWIGRVSAEKRPLEFIEAVRLAGRGAPIPIEVDMLGNGPMLSQAQDAAAALPNIHVWGAKPYEEVLGYIDNSSALVINSYRFDNQPMVIAEAVSRYRGIIYCDELLTEGTTHAGFLLSGPGAKAMAAGLRELTEQPHKLIELSKGAQIDRQLFSTDEFVNKLSTVVAKLRPAS